MSMTYADYEREAGLERMYDEIGDQLYPEHKDRALGEFSNKRLRSYYVQNPSVMVPAIHLMREAKDLLDTNHYAATVVFYGTAIELLVKATILKPIVAGLIHMESVAELVMDHATKDGYDKYLKLLKHVFQELVNDDLGLVKRPGISQTLWEECSKVRGLRNKVVHEGALRTKDEAQFARDVALAVLSRFVYPVLEALDLAIKDGTGELCDAELKEEVAPRSRTAR